MIKLYDSFPKWGNHTPKSKLFQKNKNNAID